MAFDYQHRLVWIDYLSTEQDPMAHDLCALHADGMTVPVGWELDSRLLRVEDLYPSPQARAS